MTRATTIIVSRETLTKPATMTQADIDILRHGASIYGIALDNLAIERFQKFEALLAEWSLRTNLVSKNDLGRLVTHHFLDSLKLASCVVIPETGHMLDFGSGAGFPGIPLAIAFPRATVYLVESRKKRCDFLAAAVDALGLDHVTVLSSRIETVDASYDNSFSLVMTRATVSLPVLYSVTKRFVAPGGMIAAIKGEHIEEEYASLNSVVDATLFNIEQTQPAQIPGVRTGWVVTVDHRKLSTSRSKPQC